MPRDVDPNSTAGRAIFLITRHGSMRTSAIAAELGVDHAVVSTALWPHTKTGRLVVCKVERPGSKYPPENEYRVSAGFRSSVEKDMETHRPIRRGAVVEPGPLRRTPPAGIGRVPTETAPAAASTPTRAPTVAPIVPPAPTEKAAPMAPQPQASPTPHDREPKPFRAAMASDGGLFLFLEGGNQVELSQDNTRTLVDYLRKLAELSEPARTAGPEAFRLPALLDRQVS